MVHGVIERHRVPAPTAAIRPSRTFGADESGVAQHHPTPRAAEQQELSAVVARGRQRQPAKTAAPPIGRSQSR